VSKIEKKQKKPRVSVIIPTSNRGWIIKEAIDSVMVQDYRDFELIIVDDGSTDNTPDILNSYRGDIMVFRQENQGVSAARNRGLAAASGRFVAFLDSDDLWLPRKLKRQVDFFNSNPDACICQTEEIWIRNNMRVNPKKEVNNLGGYKSTICYAQDYDLWLRISCRYPVYLIDTPLIIKRGGHNDQLSASPGLDKFRIESLKKIIASDLLSRNQYKAAVKTLKEKCKIYAAGCLKREREDEALYYMSLSDKF